MQLKFLLRKKNSNCCYDIDIISHLLQEVEPLMDTIKLHLSRNYLACEMCIKHMYTKGLINKLYSLTL